jgi:hypothetical protein
MTTSKLNRLAVAFGAAGMLAAILTTAITPAFGVSALASAKNHAATAQPASAHVATLRYVEGTNVLVQSDAVGFNATKCPRAMYPVGGGSSSPGAGWTLQWSDPDRSTPSASHPNEWTVSLFNNSSSPQYFKVFVVCSTAQKVTSNY